MIYFRRIHLSNHSTCQFYRYKIHSNSAGRFSISAMSFQPPITEGPEYTKQVVLALRVLGSFDFGGFSELMDFVRDCVINFVEVQNIEG